MQQGPHNQSTGGSFNSEFVATARRIATRKKLAMCSEFDVACFDAIFRTSPNELSFAAPFIVDNSRKINLGEGLHRLKSEFSAWNNRKSMELAANTMSIIGRAVAQISLDENLAALLPAVLTAVQPAREAASKCLQIPAKPKLAGLKCALDIFEELTSFSSAVEQLQTAIAQSPVDSSLEAWAKMTNETNCIVHTTAFLYFAVFSLRTVDRFAFIQHAQGSPRNPTAASYQTVSSFLAEFSDVEFSIFDGQGLASFTVSALGQSDALISTSCSAETALVLPGQTRIHHHLAASTCLSQSKQHASKDLQQLDSFQSLYLTKTMNLYTSQLLKATNASISDVLTDSIDDLAAAVAKLRSSDEYSLLSQVSELIVQRSGKNLAEPAGGLIFQWFEQQKAASSALYPLSQRIPAILAMLANQPSSDIGLAVAHYEAKARDILLLLTLESEASQNDTVLPIFPQAESISILQQNGTVGYTAVAAEFALGLAQLHSNADSIFDIVPALRALILALEQLTAQSGSAEVHTALMRSGLSLNTMVFIEEVLTHVESAKQFDRLTNSLSSCIGEVSQLAGSSTFLVSSEKALEEIQQCKQLVATFMPELSKQSKQKQALAGKIWPAAHVSNNCDGLDALAREAVVPGSLLFSNEADLQNSDAAIKAIGKLSCSDLKFDAIWTRVVFYEYLERFAVQSIRSVQQLSAKVNEWTAAEHLQLLDQWHNEHPATVMAFKKLTQIFFEAMTDLPQEMLVEAQTLCSTGTYALQSAPSAVVQVACLSFNTPFKPADIVIADQAAKAGILQDVELPLTRSGLTSAALCPFELEATSWEWLFLACDTKSGAVNTLQQLVAHKSSVTTVTDAYAYSLSYGSVAESMSVGQTNEAQEKLIENGKRVFLIATAMEHSAPNTASTATLQVPGFLLANETVIFEALSYAGVGRLGELLADLRNKLDAASCHNSRCFAPAAKLLVTTCEDMITKIASGVAALGFDRPKGAVLADLSHNLNKIIAAINQHQKSIAGANLIASFSSLQSSFQLFQLSQKVSNRNAQFSEVVQSSLDMAQQDQVQLTGIANDIAQSILNTVPKQSNAQVQWIQSNFDAVLKLDANEDQAQLARRQFAEVLEQAHSLSAVDLVSAFGALSSLYGTLCTTGCTWGLGLVLFDDTITSFTKISGTGAAAVKSLQVLVTVDNLQHQGASTVNVVSIARPEMEQALKEFQSSIQATKQEASIAVQYLRYSAKAQFDRLRPLAGYVRAMQGVELAAAQYKKQAAALGQISTNATLTEQNTQRIDGINEISVVLAQHAAQVERAFVIEQATVHLNSLLAKNSRSWRDNTLPLLANLDDWAKFELDVNINEASGAASRLYENALPTLKQNVFVVADQLAQIASELAAEVTPFQPDGPSSDLIDSALGAVQEFLAILFSDDEDCPGLVTRAFSLIEEIQSFVEVLQVFLQSSALSGIANAISDIVEGVHSIKRFFLAIQGVGDMLTVGSPALTIVRDLLASSEEELVQLGSGNFQSLIDMIGQWQGTVPGNVSSFAATSSELLERATGATLPTVEGALLESQIFGISGVGIERSHILSGMGPAVDIMMRAWGDSQQLWNGFSTVASSLDKAARGIIDASQSTNGPAANVLSMMDSAVFDNIDIQNTLVSMDQLLWTYDAQDCQEGAFCERQLLLHQIGQVLDEAEAAIQGVSSAGEWVTAARASVASVEQNVVQLRSLVGQLPGMLNNFSEKEQSSGINAILPVLKTSATVLRERSGLLQERLFTALPFVSEALLSSTSSEARLLGLLDTGTVVEASFEMSRKLIDLADRTQAGLAESSTRAADSVQAVVNWSSGEGYLMGIIANFDIVRVPAYAIKVFEVALEILDYVRPVRKIVVTGIDIIQQAIDIAGLVLARGAAPPDKFTCSIAEECSVMHDAAQRRNGVFELAFLVTMTHFWYETFPPAFGGCQIFGYPCKEDNWRITLPGIFEDWIPQGIHALSYRQYLVSYYGVNANDGKASVIVVLNDQNDMEAVFELQTDTGDDYIGTVGDLTVSPGARANLISGRAQASDTLWTCSDKINWDMVEDDAMVVPAIAREGHIIGFNLEDVLNALRQGRGHFTLTATVAPIHVDAKANFLHYDEIAFDMEGVLFVGEYYEPGEPPLKRPVGDKPSAVKKSGTNEAASGRDAPDSDGSAAEDEKKDESKRDAFAMALDVSEHHVVEG